MILSQQPISALSFIEDNVLAGGSNSVKSVSLWVGIDNIGSTRMETGWLVFVHDLLDLLQFSQLR